MRSRCAGIFFLIHFILLVEAQTPFLRNHQLFSGKEDYRVSQIMQDSTGFIWFGTDRGLFRFDGLSYETFTASDGLAEDWITSICHISPDLMWIGHKNGSISVYNGREFSVFQPEEGMGTVEITDIEVSKGGMIWFSTLGEGIYSYDGRHLANYCRDDGLSDDYVYDIEIGGTDDLWLATDYGLSHFSRDSFTVISMKDGLTDNIVRTLNASGGILWLGTEETGLSQYDMATGEFINYGNWTYGAVTGIVRSLEDMIWVITERGGIVKVHIRNDTSATYQQFTTEQGLISNQIYAIEKDFEENIWVGGEQGVVQILPPVFEFLDVGSGIPFEMAYSLIKISSGALWVATEKGLFRGIKGITGQIEWTCISDLLQLQGVNFISLYEDPGHQIWAGTYGHGLYIIHPETLDYKELNASDGLSDDDVIHISGKGNLVWISTLGGGINQFDLSTESLIHFEHPELGESYVYSTYPDKERRLWVAGLLNHPYYIWTDSIFYVEDSSYVFPQLYGIAADTSGSIWFNTMNEGLLRLDDRQVEVYGPEKGVQLPDIQSIAFDKHNNLLIFANTGMQIYNISKGTSILFDEHTGLGYRYPLLNSVYRDRDDQIWFGTENGIIKYNSDYLYNTSTQPRLFLSTRNLFDEAVDGNRFNYRSNNFTFGFTGLWFKNPEMLTFRYQLEGYDLDWNYHERNQIITYPKLPPGSYTFKVEVSIDGQLWNGPEEASYTFMIAPPFWKRWSFIVSVAILLVAVVWFYIRRRVALLEQAKRELEKEVSIRTEQIRKKNLELEGQKEEIESQRDYAEVQRDRIEHQKEEIQDSIRYAQRIQSAALPPDSLMKDLLGDYFIFNRPRDIVSGDFYWGAKGDAHSFFALADCTGHGVPGAFMSMLGISALNDIVRSLEHYSASVVLDRLAIRIRESLHQTDDPAETTSNDGMDISLCIYHPDTRSLQFAGANNHLYLVRGGEMKVILSDNQDISSKYDPPRSFTNQTLNLESGDCLYMFSDGFSDQFGGPDYKKYKIKYFRELLVSIHNRPVQEQARLLEEEFERWKGVNVQVDDVLVMGVRVR